MEPNIVRVGNIFLNLLTFRVNENRYLRIE